MAYTADQLKQLLEMPTYTRRSDAELQAVAGDKVASKYNQLGLAAQQQADRGMLALDKQLSALGVTYDRQRRGVETATQGALSQQSNAALARGMGRSSFNMGALGGIQEAGITKIGDLGIDEANQRNAIADQRTLVAQQLAEMFAAYEKDKVTETAAMADQMGREEFDREQQSLDKRNSLSQWIAEYIAQKDAADQSQQNWLASFDYGKERDLVADRQKQQEFEENAQRFQQEFGLRQSEAERAARQWEQEFGYGKERDAVADQRWLSDRDYQQSRDAVADQRYQQDRDYQIGRDDVADSRYQQTWDYQTGRDQVADQRYEEDRAYQQSRDAVGDERYASERETEEARYQQDVAWRVQEAQENIRRWEAEHKLSADATAQDQANWEKDFERVVNSEAEKVRQFWAEFEKRYPSSKTTAGNYTNTNKNNNNNNNNNNIVLPPDSKSTVDAAVQAMIADMNKPGSGTLNPLYDPNKNKALDAGRIEEWMKKTLLPSASNKTPNVDALRAILGKGTISLSA